MDARSQIGNVFENFSSFLSVILTVTVDVLGIFSPKEKSLEILDRILYDGNTGNMRSTQRILRRMILHRDRAESVPS